MIPFWGVEEEKETKKYEEINPKMIWGKITASLKTRKTKEKCLHLISWKTFVYTLDNDQLNRFKSAIANIAWIN